MYRRLVLKLSGQPFTTTDYPAVQRAIELGADALLVAKNGTDGCTTPTRTGCPPLNGSTASRTPT